MRSEAVKLALHSDSTATISQHTKMGLERMKHVELRSLFVKDLPKREKLMLNKIPGTKSPADLGTKVLVVNTHRHLCLIIGLGLLNRQWRRSRVTWKDLRTLGLGLAQWTQENSTSMHPHELRI